MSQIITGNSGRIIVLGTEAEVKVADGADVVLIDVQPNFVKRSLHFGRDAQVKFLRFSKDPIDDAGVENLEMTFDQGADVETTAVYFGNNNSEVLINGHVKESNVRSDIKVLYFADCPSKFMVKVRNEFYKRDSKGDIVIRGIGANKANISVFGEIGIQQTAGGTDSSLDQHSLMCGKGVKVRQLPILEIKTNDVKAAHGATVSRVQDEELFYFMARGISRAVAYELCLNGFLSVLIKETEHFGDYHQQILDTLSAHTARLIAV